MKHPALLPENEKGLTLIELLLVMAVISIITTISILSFISYNKRQVLTSATGGLYAALNAAKSRAQSQVKPVDFCGDTDELKGFKVKIYDRNIPPCSGDRVNGCSEVIVVCGSVEESLGPSSVRNFPKNVTIDSNTSIMFHVLSGEATEGNTTPINQSGRALRFSSGERSQTLTVYPDGRVTFSE